MKPDVAQDLLDFKHFKLVFKVLSDHHTQENIKFMWCFIKN